MVKISYNKLIAEAETTGFRPEILEIVFQCLVSYDYQIDLWP